MRKLDFVHGTALKLSCVELHVLLEREYLNNTLFMCCSVLVTFDCWNSLILFFKTEACLFLNFSLNSELILST